MCVLQEPRRNTSNAPETQRHLTEPCGHSQSGQVGLGKEAGTTQRKSLVQRKARITPEHTVAVTCMNGCEFFLIFRFSVSLGCFTVLPPGRPSLGIRLPFQVLSLQGDKRQRSVERQLALLTQAEHLWIQECIQLPEVGVHN